jgi:hypothetical protein
MDCTLIHHLHLHLLDQILHHLRLQQLKLHRIMIRVDLVEKVL